MPEKGTQLVTRVKNGCEMPNMVLGIDPRFSARATRVFNSRAISLALGMYCLVYF